MIYAYEVPTHKELSEAAVMKSELGTNISQIIKKYDIPAEIDLEEIIIKVRNGANFEDNTSRFFNHFFDPVNNIPLTVGGFTLGERSPDWALENETMYLSQAYSFSDGRKNFYDALTSPGLSTREDSFDLTFQTLGQVIHHLQDMAQPQHVRNDAHPPIGSHASRYEQYTDDKTIEPDFVSLLNQGYGPVEQQKPREYWTTPGNKGIADYTNRGFVSAGTGPFYPHYPEPVLSFPVQEDVRNLFPQANPPVPVPTVCNDGTNPCLMTFLTNTVVDSFQGTSQVNLRAASISIFDQDLEIHNKAVQYKTADGTPYWANQIYSLNRFNFDAAHQFLIPRAVGYSAGLIDYFFRGEIDLEIDPDFDSPGQYLIKNKIDEAMQGDFTLLYDDADGRRYILEGDQPKISWPDISIPAQGVSTALSAPKRTAGGPAMVLGGKSMLAFKGTLGDEVPRDDEDVGAVVGQQVKLLWEPWSDQLTDNHPWTKDSGTVNNISGPNSQSVVSGRLVLSVGDKGAGGVIWEASTPEDALPLGYMRMRIKGNVNPYDEGIYGWICFGTGRTINGIPWCDAYMSEIIGLAAVDSPIGMAAYQTPSEYIFSTRSIPHVGPKIVYVEIWIIGFTHGAKVEIDYLDFNDTIFNNPLPGAVYVP